MTTTQCPKCGAEVEVRQQPWQDREYLASHNAPPNEDGYVTRCGNRSTTRTPAPDSPVKPGDNCYVTKGRLRGQGGYVLSVSVQNNCRLIDHDENGQAIWQDRWETHVTFIDDETNRHRSVNANRVAKEERS